MTVDLPIGSQILSLTAPDPTIVPMTIHVGAGTAPGTYALRFQASGFENCEPIFHTLTYRLTVRPPGPLPPVTPIEIPAASHVLLLLLAATLSAIAAIRIGD